MRCDRRAGWSACTADERHDLVATGPARFRPLTADDDGARIRPNDNLL
jgi:hypothetical protein